MARRAKKPEETERIQQSKAGNRPLKYEIQLNEEQKEAKALILNNEITILTGKAGSGKAQPLYSKVLTPEGWKQMGELKVGDEVVNPDGGNSIIKGIFPQGKKKNFKISFSDGSSTECCDEHLWNVKTYLSRNKWRGSKNNLSKVNSEFETKKLSELMNNLIYKDRINYSIPITEAIKFKKKEYIIEPYLLGLLIGDGGLTGHSITYSSEDEELLNYINNCLESTNCSLKEIKNNKKYFEGRISSPRGENNFINEELINLNLKNKNSKDKFIPEIYKFGSIEQRLELLQGLMDTDGSTTGISTTFHTSSKQLRDDFIELVRSLGGVATYSIKKPKYKYKGKTYDGQEHYNISIKLPEDINPFKLKRKAEKYILKSKYGPIRYITNIEYIGEEEMQCILVSNDNHLYITDDYIVTHNTMLAVQTAIDQLFKKQIKKIYITRPAVTREDHGFLPGDLSEKLDPYLKPIYDNIERLCGEEKCKNLLNGTALEIAPIAFMRGRTIEDGILIIDEAQNVDDESLKMCLTRIGKSGKIVVCGDTAQIDLRRKSDSGLDFLVKMSSKITGIAHANLKSNHRNPIVEQILELYEQRDMSEKERKLNKGN